MRNEPNRAHTAVNQRDGGSSLESGVSVVCANYANQSPKGAARNLTEDGSTMRRNDSRVAATSSVINTQLTTLGVGISTHVP